MEKIPEIRIALVQTDLHWEDKTANLAMLEEKIWGLKGNADLIILPEMFPTGFSMDASKLAEPMNLTVCKWMKQLAAQTQATLTGSAIISEGGKFFNRLLWVNPEGIVEHYDKRHLFRMAKEEETFSAGKKLPVFSLKGWKFCPQVCYDLRFPVWSRNGWDQGNAGYDILFFVASWPASRVSAWDALLPARAIENLSFSIGVNRVGIDGKWITYNGHSAAYNFKGEKILDLAEKEEIQIVSFSANELEVYRSKFPAWRDADSFQIL
ncbi:amidohydrolase [Algoriphagus sp.]|uniref:amidohydrolase n=1 Tax=Algoriphagus sp. TaxID=1872435 RepID=UPI00271CB473|nr:amidohydrolase [Algoriphagus sp.]MDO8965363.1 amidohydrolase [Algoriphagus sp.]MDP3198795.1 amidohydrolase [Algoriphagus sp.]